MYCTVSGRELANKVFSFVHGSLVDAFCTVDPALKFIGRRERDMRQMRGRIRRSEKEESKEKDEDEEEKRAWMTREDEWHEEEEEES